MKVVVLHPTGNKNVRSVLSGLNDAGMLVEFNTTLAVNANSAFIKFLPSKFKKEFLRRTYSYITPEQIKIRPLRELSRMLFIKLGWLTFIRPERGWASIDAVYYDLDKSVSKRLSKLKKAGVNAVYAYEDGALECFKIAKELGMKCVYELPIAYWETSRDLMQQEAFRKPQWEITLGGGTRDSLEKLKRKTKELELADVIIVSSSFVKDSLPEWAKCKKVIMSPFGSPDSSSQELDIKDRKDKAKLRVLFAGSMGQRKGLSDLFDAIKILNSTNIELVVMGSLLAPMEFYKSQLPEFTYEPGRSNEQVLELMRSCDVFCLPSIVEGRALVMQEAMSQGLPLIITPNTGGSDLIIEGETGFLVPIDSPKKIAESLEWFLNNREKIPEMGKRAKLHAAKYSWKQYATTIIDEIKNL